MNYYGTSNAAMAILASQQVSPLQQSLNQFRRERAQSNREHNRAMREAVIEVIREKSPVVTGSVASSNDGTQLQQTVLPNSFFSDYFATLDSAAVGVVSLFNNFILGALETATYGYGTGQHPHLNQFNQQLEGAATGVVEQVGLLSDATHTVLGGGDPSHIVAEMLGGGTPGQQTANLTLFALGPILRGFSTVRATTYSPYAAKSEVNVYRAFGGDSRAQGFSWTTTDPRTVSNFRDVAGLPSGGASGATNTADFLIQGKVNPADIEMPLIFGP